MQYRYISDTHVYIRYTCILKKKQHPKQQNSCCPKKNHLVYYHYLFFIECEGYIKTHFCNVLTKNQN